MWSQAVDCWRGNLGCFQDLNPSAGAACWDARDKSRRPAPNPEIRDVSITDKMGKQEIKDKGLSSHG